MRTYVQLPNIGDYVLLKPDFSFNNDLGGTEIIRPDAVPDGLQGEILLVKVTHYFTDSEVGTIYHAAPVSHPLRSYYFNAFHTTREFKVYFREPAIERVYEHNPLIRSRSSFSNVYVQNDTNEFISEKLMEQVRSIAMEMFPQLSVKAVLQYMTFFYPDRPGTVTHFVVDFIPVGFESYHKMFYVKPDAEGEQST
jgi:hypothetical protein